jgi:WD40 repeat protein
MNLDRSRLLSLGYSNKPPEVFDLSRGVSLGAQPGLGPGSNILGSSTPWLCRWDGTNQIVVEQLNGSQFTRRGAVTPGLGLRPSKARFNPARQVVVWLEPAASNSIFLAALSKPGRRMELKTESAGGSSLLFSDDGIYLAVMGPRTNFSQIWDRPALRIWNTDTGQSVMTLSETVQEIAFAAGGRVLVAFVLVSGVDHEIRFYDLEHPDRAPQLISGKHGPRSLEVSQDGRLVAAATDAGTVRLCDAVSGQWMEDLHGHLDEVCGLAFSKDGRRLVSSGSAREAVKLWDVGTRQELLTFPGTTGSPLYNEVSRSDVTLSALKTTGTSLLISAWWSTDEDTIIAGPPWQSWHAPSWEEIAAAEGKDPPSPGYGGQEKADLSPPATTGQDSPARRE